MSTQPGSATPTLQVPRNPERLLNSREVAAMARRLSLDYVQAHATGNPQIPAVRLGIGRQRWQMLRFRREDVEKFILDHMSEPVLLRVLRLAERHRVQMATRNRR